MKFNHKKADMADKTSDILNFTTWIWRGIHNDVSSQKSHTNILEYAFNINFKIHEVKTIDKTENQCRCRRRTENCLI